MMSSIYARIAKRYGMTSSGVERGIRNAIEMSWNATICSELIEDVFGKSIPADKDKPTNMQFVFTSANYIKYKYLT